LVKKDYYELLGIDRDASQAEVKRAYRRLARKYHPDVNPGDATAAQKFKEIREAYEVLSNPLTRDAYDQFGESVPPPSPPGAPGGGRGGVGDEYATPSPGGTSAAQVEDVFSTEGIGDIYDVSPGVAPMRGVPPPRVRGEGPQAGADLRYDLEISFEDAAFGLETEIEVPRLEECATCRGTGTQPGSVTLPCNACRGTGEVKKARQTPFGQLVSYTMCDKCQGRGEIITSRCAQCNGTGYIQKLQRIFLKIPPGVDNGSRLRIRGKGEPGIRGGQPGDLYVVIYVREHEFFERRGYEILCETSISFVQAVFGAEIEVPTLEGTAKMKIPPGTQSGTIFRLRGKGIPSLQTGTRGDQHVKVSVITPTGLNEKQKSLLWKFAAATGEDLSSLRRRGKR
jgi:molecular chaperone DnaJ